MLKYAKMDGIFWADAVNTIIYILNRVPTKALDGMTPKEAWSGERIDISNLRVFGCTFYMHIPKEQRKNIDEKSKRFILLRYDNESKAYTIINPTTRKIYISRYVIFDDTGESLTSPPAEVPELDYGPIINYDDEDDKREAPFVNLPPHIPMWYQKTLQD